MRHLINIVNEAEVKPGERKNISFKVNRLEKILKKLNQYKKNAETLRKMELPNSTAEDLSTLLSKVDAEISKVQKVHDEISQQVESKDAPIKVTNFFNGLLKNCKQVLATYKMLNQDIDSTQINDLRFMFRGIKGQNSDAIYGKPFLNRKPKDSPKIADMLFNLGMKEAGFEARRDNSSFVSGSDSHAGGYGNLYIMFPIDGFKYTWSKKHDDLVLPESFVKSNMVNKTVVNKIKKELEKLDSEVLYKLKWDYDMYLPGTWSTGLALANMDEMKEAINDGVLPEEFSRLIEEALNTENIKKAIASYQLTDTDLASAIMSDHEIYVSGPYYAIKDTNKNRKMLIEFLNSSTLSDKELPPNAGKMGNKHLPGAVVKILSGNYAGLLATVVKWAGSNTEVSVTTKLGYHKNILIPGDDLETIDNNIKELPSPNDLVMINSTGDLATVSSVYNPHSIYVNLGKGNNFSTTRVKKHDITKINIPEVNYQANDKVILIKPNSYYTKTYGKLAVINKVYKHKVIVNLLTKTGKPSTSMELTKKDILPIDSDLARRIFPNIAAGVTPPIDNRLASVVKELQPKIQQGMVTYPDIDLAISKHLGSATDNDIDQLINILGKQGVTVKPLNIPDTK